MSGSGGTRTPRRRRYSAYDRVRCPIAARQPPAAGGDDPTPPRGTPSDAGARAGPNQRAWKRLPTEHEAWDVDEWGEPNYLVRRALVVAVVVAAVAGAAILASRFIGGDDSPRHRHRPLQTGTPSWCSAPMRFGSSTAIPPTKSRPSRVADDLLDAQSLVAGNVLVTMTDEGRITQTDLGDGSERRSRSGLDETLRIAPDHPLIALSGPTVVAT